MSEAEVIKAKKAENEKLRKEIEMLEKSQLSQPSMAEIEDNIAVLSNEYISLLQEKENKTAQTQKLSKDVSELDSLVKTTMKMYKDLKGGVEQMHANHMVMQKTVAEVDANTIENQQEIEKLTESVSTVIASSQEEIAKVKENSTSSGSGLQSQLKVVESKLRSLQAQLDQKVNDNQELTKICDELISQQSHKK